MTIHTNYPITILHPITKDSVEALVSFDYYKGSEGYEDEPPNWPEAEIINCIVDDEDIYDLLEPWQIDSISRQLLATMLLEEVGYAESDWFDYDAAEKYYRSAIASAKLTNLF